MELQQLRIFLAVAEELHFGRAAERLHMAQPPVSRNVGTLEKELGVRLFDRNTRNVRLTAAGTALVESAREIIAAADRVRDVVVSAEAGDRGRVEIAFAGASTYGLVGELARELRRRHPGITPGLHSQNFAQPALDRVLSGEMDIGLGRWDFLPAGVESRVVQREELVLAVPATHALAGEDSVGMAQFSEEPFVTLPAHAGSVLRDRLHRLAHEARFEPQIAQVAPDTWTALALVGAGVGATLTLSSVQQNVTDPHVRFLPLRDRTLPVHLRMAWLPGNPNPVLSRVFAVAEDVWSLGAEEAGA
jgi:DNA-binding transcriptional LysR family regulator